MELKVAKFGDSLGVVLPSDFISRLGAAEGELLFLIEGADGTYHLTPHDSSSDKKKAAADDIIRRYSNTLDALAK